MDVRKFMTGIMKSGVKMEYPTGAIIIAKERWHVWLLYIHGTYIL